MFKEKAPRALSWKKFKFYNFVFSLPERKRAKCVCFALAFHVIFVFFRGEHSFGAVGIKNTVEMVYLVAETARKKLFSLVYSLNAASVEAAMSMIAGTCRSMGITVEE